MQVHIKRTISVPAKDAWDYLADYSNIHRFHPLLKGSNFIEGAQSCEIGSTRQCDMKDGSYIKERVIEWQEGSHYTVDIYDTSMPIKEARATLGIKPIDKTQSHAYMQVQLTPKWILTQPVLFLAFKYVVGPGILKGLEKLYIKEQKLIPSM